MGDAPKIIAESIVTADDEAMLFAMDDWRGLKSLPKEGVIELGKFNEDGNLIEIAVISVKRDLSYFSSFTKWRPVTEDTIKRMEEYKKNNPNWRSN